MARLTVEKIAVVKFNVRPIAGTVTVRALPRIVLRRRRMATRAVHIMGMFHIHVAPADRAVTVGALPSPVSFRRRMTTCTVTQSSVAKPRPAPTVRTVTVRTLSPIVIVFLMTTSTIRQALMAEVNLQPIFCGMTV